jgi:nitrilase
MLVQKSYVAAVVQWAPSFANPQLGAERASDAIRQAAEAGARLVVFPEAWLAGYPYFEDLSRHPDYMEAWRRFARGAVAIDGPEIGVIAQSASRHGVEVVIGVNEASISKAVYNTMVFIGSDGSIRGRHRKFMPTITEKLVWTMGDGSDLDSHETSCGRLGGLLCYENHMSLARFACCTLGVEVHISMWPGHGFLNSVIDANVRQTALENACFVISAREVMDPSLVPDDFPLLGEPALWRANGGSAIVAPGGEYLAGPEFEAETILTATIELDRILDTKWWVNPDGNYARPDVFQLLWNRNPKPNVIYQPGLPDEG